MEIKFKFTQNRITYTEEEVTGVLKLSKKDLARIGLNTKADKDTVFDEILNYPDIIEEYINSPNFTKLDVKTVRTYEDEDNPYDQDEFELLDE